MKPFVAVFLLSATLGCGEGGESADALRESAEQGDASAQYSLGVKYSNGDGVPEDDAEAARWYRLAADQGLAEAQFRLGNMYDFATGVPEDNAEAVRLLRLAAEQGHADAQYNIGLIYWYATADTPEDRPEAVRWYRLAAEQGHADAMLYFGMAYATGQGVPQDFVQGHMWFNLAASRLTDMGRMLREGKVNLREANLHEDRQDAVEGRDALTNLLTPEQIAEAQRLASEWDAAHPR